MRAAYASLLSFRGLRLYAFAGSHDARSASLRFCRTRFLLAPFLLRRFLLSSIRRLRLSDGDDTSSRRRLREDSFDARAEFYIEHFAESHRVAVSRPPSSPPRLNIIACLSAPPASRQNSSSFLPSLKDRTSFLPLLFLHFALARDIYLEYKHFIVNALTQ